MTAVQRDFFRPSARCACGRYVSPCDLACARCESGSARLARLAAAAEAARQSSRRIARNVRALFAGVRV